MGRCVRLDVLTEADLPHLHPILSDPRLYAVGYVMHGRPETVEDSCALGRRRFLRGRGELDGKGGGRAPYGERAGTTATTSTSYPW